MNLVTMLPETVIKTDRLVLRPMVESDLDGVVAAIGDFGVSRMLARVPHPYCRSDGLAYLAMVEENRGRDLALAITLDGRAIGGIGITGIHSGREFGYWLARAAWGKGFASEAGAAFLAHVFDVLSVDLIRSGVFVDNPASFGVQKKLGFVEIGRRMVHCLARGVLVEHVDTILPRPGFREMSA